MNAPLQRWLIATLWILGAVVSRADENAPAELKKLSLEALLNVEVTTVSRTESTVGESAAAITVITSEMIRRSGATTIPELLRMVPGLDVARIDGNKWAIGSRGLNNRFQHFLLVQIDGRSVYTPLTSGVFWDALDYPLADIDRIEVIRGPGASVWGANAVSGIINIITKSSKDTHGGLVSAGGGTAEQGFGAFRYGGLLATNLNYRVYGKGFNRAKDFSPQGDPNDQWWGMSEGLRLDWTPAERDTVTFDGGYTRSEAGAIGRYPVAVGPPFAVSSPFTQTTQDGHVLARWSHQLDTGNSWQLQAYWDRFQIAGDNGFVSVRDWDTYDLDFQHQFPLGQRQKIVWGLGCRFVEANLHDSPGDNGFYLDWLDNHPEMQVFSGFVQDEIALVPDRLRLTLGTKLEHNNYTGVEVEPSGRLLWTPTNRQSVWAAVSRAVRTPSFTDVAAQLTGVPPNPANPPTTRTVANPDLETENVVAYELGYRVQATDAFSVDAALFYNVYRGLRVGRRDPALDTTVQGDLLKAYQFANGMDGETYGAELAANWRLTDWWRLYGTYSYLDIQLHVAKGLAKSNEATEGQSPHHQVYLESSWDLPANVEFDLISRFVDRLTGFNPGGPGDTVRAYFALDARLAWRARKNLELAVIGQNLIDRHHSEFGTNPLVSSPLVELQRGVYGKVTYWW